MSKKDDYVTNKKLEEAVDAILTGVEEMVNGSKNDLKNELKVEIEKNRNEIEKNRKEIRENRRQISGLKHDTLTRKEFEELKGKVDRYQVI
jgi:hypothetical protein